MSIDPKTSPELPEYAEMLLARHRAHSDTFRDIVAKMPFSNGARVLDVACGDGSWCRWLAERAGAEGHVAGIDLSPGFLALANELTGERVEGRASISLGEADATSLPFPNASFDAVCCAHSLYDFDAPQAVLQEMLRVLRPGGHLCIVTADILQHAQLPWPPAVELALKRALAAALDAEGDRRPFLPRKMPEVLGHLALTDIEHVAFATTRQGPLPPDEHTYLRGWLSVLERRARPHLSDDDASRLNQWIAKSLSEPDATFNVTYTDMLTHGTSPSRDSLASL